SSGSRNPANRTLGSRGTALDTRRHQPTHYNPGGPSGRAAGPTSWRSPVPPAGCPPVGGPYARGGWPGGPIGPSPPLASPWLPVLLMDAPLRFHRSLSVLCLLLLLLAGCSREGRQVWPARPEMPTAVAALIRQTVESGTVPAHVRGQKERARAF